MARPAAGSTWPAPAQRTPSRRKNVEVPGPVQWLLASVTLSAAFVRNGRMDVVATNPLARALHAPMFATDTTGRLKHHAVGRPELTYQSLDLPVPHRAVHDLTLYTAEPGRRTPEDRLKLLTSLAAPQPRATEPTDPLR
ncbi:MmyB family transcriptional regulator [Streptomyces lydicus]|uniref:MmyB family transcriptional regulator n=1 Tax=Streptomyces lydicus TaxID=47763 RepID=UPI0037BC8030